MEEIVKMDILELKLIEERKEINRKLKKLRIKKEEAINNLI